MEKIEGQELNGLVQEAADKLLRLRRDEAVEMIQSKLKRVAVLTSELHNLDQQTKKLQGKLDNALVIIEKLRAGDWSVLQEDKNQQQEKQA